MVAAQEEAALLVLVGDEKIEDFGGLTPAIGIITKKDKMVGGLNVGSLKDLCEGFDCPVYIAYY